MPYVLTEKQPTGLPIDPIGRFVRRTRWSLRKLLLPIGATDLVLDVGSGSAPHPRADVLLERYPNASEHRHGAAAVVNRPMVFADACRMPFKDKAFDYVIAFHVLEHVPTPAVFLTELMRVARAGYIETPNVMFERFAPYEVHCLEVMDVGGRLLLNKKRAPVSDPFMAKVSESAHWNAFFYSHPQYFHVCYHWRDHIEFEVTNPDEPCAWYTPDAPNAEESTPPAMAPPETATGPRGLVIEGFRRYYQRSRKSIDLKALLTCPACRSDLVDEGTALWCRQCDVRYPCQPWPTFV